MINKICDTPEIWQIYVELPNSTLKNLNSYVIKTQKENLVIDTGFNMAECRRDLWGGIEEIGLDLSRTSLFVTHLHGDHCGQATLFEEKGCRIYMSERDYNYHAKVIEGENVRIMENLYFSEGYPYSEMEKRALSGLDKKRPDMILFNAGLLRDGDSLPIGDIKNTVIDTRGHSPGHMVLYLPDYQILFSGDHILFDISPNIGVWIDEKSSLKDYLESLDKISRLPIKLTLPAHRSTFHKDVYQRIDELKKHHSERLEEVKSILQSIGPSNGYTVAGNMTWNSRGRAWNEMSPRLQWFATGEAIAHLYYLLDRGDIKREWDGKIYLYSLS